MDEKACKALKRRILHQSRLHSVGMPEGNSKAVDHLTPQNNYANTHRAGNVRSYRILRCRLLVRQTLKTTGQSLGARWPVKGIVVRIPYRYNSRRWYMAPIFMVHLALKARACIESAFGFDDVRRLCVRALRSWPKSTLANVLTGAV